MNALVTGASGGIGLELARLLAADGHSLTLVARSEDRLNAVAEELGGARVVAIDLTNPSAPATIAEQVPEVDILINNAGYGDFGPFATSHRDKQLGMIDLNIRALTELTHRYLPGMIERGQGRILNVASVAAFAPGPLMAVYFASKAYVLAFSEALHEELRGTNVTVTALCPGPTESGFQVAADEFASRLIAGRKLAGSAGVAAGGYRALNRGRAVHVTGWQNRFFAASVRLVPRPVVRRLLHRIQQPL